MQESEIYSWRDLLKQILLQERDLREQLAEEIRVNVVTLMRWTRGMANPHRANLEQLLVAPSFPVEYREQMCGLIQKEFVDFSPVPFRLAQNVSPSIPGEFYHRVLRAYATTDEGLAYDVVVQLTMQQVELHLGKPNVIPGIFLFTRPERRGSPVQSLYTPMHPSGARLSSLPRMFPVLAGVETTLSFALRGPTEPQVFPLDEKFRRSILPELKEMRSTVVVPLQRRGKLGGCFVLVCRQDLDSPLYTQVAAEYALLLSLGLSEQDFYSPHEIRLGVIPDLDEQLEKEKLYPFSERMKRMQQVCMGELLSSGGTVEGVLSLDSLERAALRDLERELISQHVPVAE